MPDQSDTHYTPDWVADRVAEELARQLTHSQPRLADYAAGDGALLHAAARRFPKAKLVATDIDRAAVVRLRRANPTWQVGVCDLLSGASRASSPRLDNPTQRVHGVVLNPPFSYRGNKSYGAFGGSIRCSPAAAFLAAAVEQVANGGSAVALLPSGSLASQRDERIWARLREAANVTVVDQFGRGTFPGEHAAVTLVSLGAINRASLTSSATEPVQMHDGAPSSSADVQARDATSAVEVTLHRGSQQMHRLPPQVRSGGTRLIHSTHLRDGRLIAGPRIDPVTAVVAGPAVLVPRVGAPKRSKVVLHAATDEFVLSDCMFALVGRTKTITKKVHRALVAHWDDLEAVHHGSCAPYLTVHDLEVLIGKLGHTVAVARRTP